MGGDAGKPTPFFGKSSFEITEKRITQLVLPRVRIGVPQERLIVLQLARAGYGAGDPDKIEQMDVQTVIELWHFHQFTSEYEETATELNKPK